MPENQQSTSSRPRRARTTKRSVLLADRIAQLFITLGGVGTILAISLVCVFLVWVVLPLFQKPSSHLASEVEVAASGSPRVVRMGVDEYKNLGWRIHEDGRLVTCQISRGRTLQEIELFGGRQPLAWSFSSGEGIEAAASFADGTVQVGRIAFVTTFLDANDIPPEVRSLAPGEPRPHGDAVFELTSEGQVRRQQLVVRFDDPVRVAEGDPLVLVDQSISSRGAIFAVLTKSGELHVAQVTKRKNLMTGKETTRLREGWLNVDLPQGQLPKHLKLAGLGDAVYLVWDDGRLARFDTRNIERPVLAEELDLVEGVSERVTALEMLNGKTSLVCGDTSGRVRVWFRTKPGDAQTPDGGTLVVAHEFPPRTTAVTGLAASSRSRLLAAGYADGRACLFHVTSGRQLSEVAFGGVSPEVSAISIAPQDDGLVMLGGDRLAFWRIDAPHPETSLASVFGRVWYEGYNEPEHAWQSSSGTDDFEEKYGLVPLVFGTLKATLYSMLFGAPLALLAAIYSSEFLRPSTKAKIKPTIEIMASLPSVVLGFLAALVIAPLVEGIVPETLVAFFTIPFAFLLGGHLWQLLSTKLSVRAQAFRLGGILLALPVGAVLARWLGRPFERWLFAGDIKAWLDGQIGSGIGGWFLLLLPVSSVVTALLFSFLVTPRLRAWGGHWSRTRFALLDLVKFLAGCGLTLALAYGVSAGLAAAGWDPRGSFIDTYVQRNAMVVGFLMGFAVIPIIYTISDDALGAVPESLRAGSLGAGATPWQTAFRVVVPTAMSGLFSALMIGLGRAVGETMIVLMAAGNTAVMEWNIFNGFRTLSANIAVELPEAVINSTHYRMLFLAALSLFAITFVINTVAELVRLRFRKRAFQL
jgi:phosphate transport system permease protein